MTQTVAWLALALALLLAGSGPARAHKASDSYLTLTIDGQRITGHWDIALRDIDFALGLDADDNGEITWGEVRAAHPRIAAWALSSLAVRRGGDCTLTVAEQLVDEHTDGHYSVLPLQGECPATAGSATVAYRLLFPVDALHRGLLNLTLDGTSHVSVFAPQSGEQVFSDRASSSAAQFGHYLRQGVHHIWIGIDHILFLLALLLPAVLTVAPRGAAPGVGFAAAAREVLRVVTAFTVAHSITLSLAALGMVSLPSRLVESVIAASVVFAAAGNLRPGLPRSRWPMAFGFGLIHGFGFASVLADLGLPEGALVIALVGFNVGVELGQIAIVGALLPLGYLLGKTRFPRRGVLVGGSVLIGLVALVWFAERAFNLKIFGF